VTMSDGPAETDKPEPEAAAEPQPEANQADGKADAADGKAVATGAHDDADIADAPPPGADEAAHDPLEMRHRWRVFTILSLLSLIADQATKIWARASLPTTAWGGHPTGDNGACAIPDDIMHGICQGQPVKVIESFWHWRLSMNPGSAFGLFASGGTWSRVLLSVIGIAAVVLMFGMLKKARPDQKILHWALALIASGAVGNLMDRLYYGVVTDFILWHVGEPNPNHISWEHEWPVFNVADIVLVIGVGLMVIDMGRDWQRDRDKKARRIAKAKAAGLIRDL
jgi:signal peptidase II